MSYDENHIAAWQLVCESDKTQPLSLMGQIDLFCSILEISKSDLLKIVRKHAGRNPGYGITDFFFHLGLSLSRNI